MYDILLRLMDLCVIFDGKARSMDRDLDNNLKKVFVYGLNNHGYRQLKLMIANKNNQLFGVEFSVFETKIENDVFSINSVDSAADFLNDTNKTFIQINRDDITNQDLNIIFRLTHGRKFTDKWFLDHFKKYRDLITKEEILKFLDWE